MKELKVEFKPQIREMQFLGKKLSLSRLMGENTSPFTQKDVEFEEYKQFSFGDDSHSIDWKASLRSRKLLIRKAVQRRNYNIFFLVDVSESMLYSSTGKLKCEYAAELTSSLSYYFLRHSESVGMALFTDRIVKMIPANLGKNQFMQITSALSAPGNYGGQFKFSTVLRRLEKVLLPSSVLIIVSDFLGLDKDWKKGLEIACQRFDVRGLVVRDPQDMQFTERIGNAVLQDPYSDRKMLIDIEHARLPYERNAKRQLEDVERTFKGYGGDSLLLLTTQPFVKPVMKFFSKGSWQ